jgi:hypothetical protein
MQENNWRRINKEVEYLNGNYAYNRINNKKFEFYLPIGVTLEMELYNYPNNAPKCKLKSSEETISVYDFSGDVYYSPYEKSQEIMLNKYFVKIPTLNINWSPQIQIKDVIEEILEILSKSKKFHLNII